MRFRALLDPVSLSLSYLLADRTTNEAVLIDPALRYIERDLMLLVELGLRLVYTIETHQHPDRRSATALLAERTGAARVASMRATDAPELGVASGDMLWFGAHRIEVLETPGHTMDSVSLLIGARVFTGGALLVRRSPEIEPSGDAVSAYNSVHRVLFALHGALRVHPAHDVEGRLWSTIEEERRYNPIAHQSCSEFAEQSAQKTPRRVVALPRRFNRRSRPRHPV
jgi:glyoxylase-like metal-dependent hydrolase (beta-lactamase superfamily II)